jgi:EmrB/QacA subfamily drug resistance transporter
MDESTVDTHAAPPGQEAQSPGSPPDPRRWKALIVLGLVQFMLVVDVTVVNVALPRIQHDLKFSQAGLAWVVNSYVIMAGGLLLLGGRLSDVFGRRRQFLIGVVVFALASVASGAAVNSSMLVTSRFVQGMGEALAAPAALGLIALLFTDPAERMKALGAWGGISGLAGVSGVVISGALTDLASWRWIFFINVPIGLVALLLVPRLVAESRMVREESRLDFTGAITATGGLIAVVFGLLQAASHPWGSVQVLLPLLGGIALLVLMVGIEARSAAPLIPLRFFTDRTRAVANVIALFFLAGFISYFFLLTLFQQQVLGFSPLKGGLAYVPFGLSMGVGVGIGAGLMSKTGIKPMLSVGFLGSAVALFMTGGIRADSSYASAVLPWMIMFGVFAGMAMPAIGVAALHGVTGQDSGLASGVQQAVQQVGGALGLATLVTLALRYSAGQIAHGTPAQVAITHGYALSLRLAGGMMAVSFVLVVLLMAPMKAEAPGGAPAEVEAGTPVPDLA